MHTSCSSQNQSENSKKPKVTRLAFFTYVNIYGNVIFLYYRKENGQNYLESLFLNAFINVEISFFLQIGSKYSLKLIKWGIFHSASSNRAVVLTGANGSNRITLIF